MSTPLPKRRRLNNSAVNKPFKSPFRTPLKTADSNVPAHTPAPTETPLKSTTTISTPRPKSTIARTPRATPLLNRTPKPPELLAEEIKYRELTRQIITHRQDIDILTQALALSKSSTDDNLEELVTKWRTAAQQAAEAVFASARDRVNRMGGVGAWVEREEERKKTLSAWDQEPEKKDEDEEFDENGEPLSEGEMEERRKVRREMREAVEEDWSREAMAEVEREAGGGAKKAVGKEGDTFTMEMMLGNMGIECEKVGWNRERQVWET